ncbi:MAG: trigger factor, partial [Patescibacteria group bacterium]
MVKNEDNVQVNILPGSKVVFSIKVLPDEMHKISLRALKKLGQDLALGGFRKGKAPIEILKDQVDKDKWLLEAVDLAVTEKYYDAVMLYKDKYVTITSPKIDFEGKLEHDSMEKGFIFKAEVDVYPEVELPDYEKIKIDRLDSAISDEEIQKAVTEIRNKRSTLADTLEGHEAQTGEWLDIDFDVFVDGQEIKEAGAKHFPLVIGNNTLIPGFEEELLGLKKGANKTF